MTRLDRLFAPSSVAVVGASADPESISGRPLAILLQHGYRGRLYPVNPRHAELLGMPCYPDLASLPEPVDVALVVVGAARVVEVLRACAAAGVGFAVVISSGFAEQRDADEAAQRALAEVVAAGPTRICGPNCEGLINVPDGVPLGFSPTIDYERGLTRLIPGEVSVVAQSGALAFAMLGDGLRRELGFSCVVSSGNELDLEIADYVEHLVEDPRTRVILLFLEGLRRGRRFPAVAERARAAGKSIVVAKVGRSEAAQRAAVSHTAHLAGHDAAYDALFARCGVLRARDQEEMVDFALALSRSPPAEGDRIGIVTVSGGAGTWLADALADEGLQVPGLDPERQALIAAHLPAYGSAANPIDVTAQVLGTAGALAEVLGLALASPQLDALVLVVTLAGTRLIARERARLEALLASADKPVLVYSYTQASPEGVALMAELGLPWYTSPRRAARAVRALVDHGRARRHPPPAAPAPARPRGALPVPGDPRPALLEHEAKELLASWGLPTPAGRFAAGDDDALRAAAGALTPPLCLKAQSPALLHKSEVGGVALDLADPDQVVAAAARMRVRVPAGLDGFLVEEMAGPGVEMIAGGLVEADLGPFVLAGTGGIYTEVLRDSALWPAPLSEDEALSLIAGLRGAALLDAPRGGAPADTEAFARCLVLLGALLVAHEHEIREVDLNPVRVAPLGQGACILDATIVLR